jgi:acetyl esterase/lipase
MRALGVVAAVVVVAAAWAGVAQDSDRSWLIGPRKLPPSEGASQRLRKLLADMPAPTASPAPTTLAGWKELIAVSEAAHVAAAETLIEQLEVKVAEEKIGGVRVYRVTPPRVAPEHASRLFVHLHGGAFILGRGRGALVEAAQIASKLGIPVLSIDYRLAPEHPAPAAMDDIVAVWRGLLEKHDPAHLALGGTSAGGNLTLVATLRMKDLGLALPAALFAGTPGADLANRGDTRFINQGIDHVLVGWETLEGALALYVGDKKVDDPYVSPIFGDFTGFPPAILVSGTRDLLLSDTVRVHRKLRKAGVAADLHVYEGMAHADYIAMTDTPESAEHYAELNAFLSRHLAR